MQRAYDDVGARRARLERLKDLYGWGDIAKDAYLAEREQVQEELRALGMDRDQAEELARLASFLRDVRKTWAAASAEQKNRLARALQHGLNGWAPGNRRGAPAGTGAVLPAESAAFGGTVKDRRGVAVP